MKCPNSPCSCDFLQTLQNRSHMNHRHLRIDFSHKVVYHFENLGLERTGMLIGYSRTSTTDQVAGFEAQKRDLEAAGCAEIFSEQVSAFQKRNELVH
jgi:hypothetical protein